MIIYCSEYVFFWIDTNTIQLMKNSGQNPQNYKKNHGQSWLLTISWQNWRILGQSGGSVGYYWMSNLAKFSNFGLIHSKWIVGKKFVEVAQTKVKISVTSAVTIAAIEANNDIYCLQKRIEKFPLMTNRLHCNSQALINRIAKGTSIGWKELNTKTWTGTDLLRSAHLNNWYFLSHTQW